MGKMARGLNRSDKCLANLVTTLDTLLVSVIYSPLRQYERAIGG